MKSLITYWGPVILLALAIFVQSSFPSPEIAPRFAFSDKLLHVIAYGVLAALCRRALLKASSLSSKPRMQLVLVAILMASLYGLSDEWHQSFVAARHGDLYDFMADIVGSCLGALGHLLWVECLSKRR